MTHFATKQALRTGVLAARRARGDIDRNADDQVLLSTLLKGLRGVRTVAAYAPIGTEPGRGLPDALVSGGHAVLLPVVLGDNDLDWAAYRHAADLAPAGRGLTEPVGPRLGPGAIACADAVVVPAVAIGLDGSRLGRGGGSYDRALGRVRTGVPVVALVYDAELRESVPTEPHDIRVTAVVTPAGGWLELPAPGGSSRQG